VVTLITASGEITAYEQMGKLEVAKTILQKAATMLPQKSV
jgi:hypothetical protein